MKALHLCTIAGHKRSCSFGISIYDETTNEKNVFWIGRKKKVQALIAMAKRKHPEWKVY